MHGENRFEGGSAGGDFPEAAARLDIGLSNLYAELKALGNEYLG